MRKTILLFGLAGAGCAPDLVIDGTPDGGAAGTTTTTTTTTGGAGGGQGGHAGGMGGGGSEGGMGGSPAACGNGVPEAGEACDDGNGSDADDCTTRCALQRVVQLSTGAEHACALLHDGRVKCWGSNQYGQLGIGEALGENRGDEGHEMGAALPAVDLGGVAAVQIECGVIHTCALLADGAVRCWGNNGVGELGLELPASTLPTSNVPAPPVDLGTALAVDHLSAGSSHTCARFGDGSAKCWGFGLHGQLGVDSAENHGQLPGEMGADLPFVITDGATIQTIRAGNMHTCALLSGGLVRCWGYNGRGQLGTDSIESLGDAPGEMAALATLVLDGPATAIGGGTESSCALLAGGAIQCWGLNDQGQLGIGHRLDWGDEPGEMASLPTIALGEPADALSVGINHACALLAGGGLKCWGENSAGGLGQGSQFDLGVVPNDLSAAPAIDLGGVAVVAVAPRGFAFNCGLFDDGAVRCWGYNHRGQLGLERVDNIGDQPGEMGAALSRVRLFSEVW
jgi:cysteine-rich repeat protein